MNTILVVDDEPNIQELVRLYLEKDGLKVELAGSGREKRSWEKRKPEVI